MLLNESSCIRFTQILHRHDESWKTLLIILSWIACSSSGIKNSASTAWSPLRTNQRLLAISPRWWGRSLRSFDIPIVPTKNWVCSSEITPNSYLEGTFTSHSSLFLENIYDLWLSGLGQEIKWEVENLKPNSYFVCMCLKYSQSNRGS